MKTIVSMIVAAAAVTGTVGVASAQNARPVAPNAFDSAVPFDGPVLSGRSAYVGGADTSAVYGNGLDGQGRLAPHINGIF